MAIITESQWVNYFGFQRFPFDRPEAGNEEFSRPDFLASCFVEPKGFERVFGQADSPVTSLLFAARGTGKTACRVMMDYYCKNGLARLNAPKTEAPSYVLSIPHTRLDHVLAIARRVSPQHDNPPIRVEHHVEEIMKQAMPVFVDMIARNSNFTDQVGKLSKGDFEDLSLFLVYYSAYLSSPQQLFLKELGVTTPPITEPMRGFAGLGESERPPSWESVLYQQRLTASPLQHLEQWAKLMRKIGIHATYVLVDGVDELMDSAGDPNYAHYLIRPLLTHLRLMDETHYLALKFFLPSDVKPLVISDPAFRKDRGFIIQTIEWHMDDLIRILRERLNILKRTDFEIRDRTAAGFDSLCVPELRGEIEVELAQNAYGNPRYLMNICAQMVAAHCSREIKNQDDPFQLSREDYYSAIESVKMKYRSLSSVLDEINKKDEVTKPKDLKQEPAIFENGHKIDGKYEVRKLLPPGAAGQVYCVYDEIFDRLCALKVYNNSSLSTDSFKVEARSLRKINHPHIVKIYDWGVLKQTGRFYLVSEFIEGDELTKFTLPGSLLLLQKALQTILELLSALEYIHPDTERLNELRNKMQGGEIEQEEYEEFTRLKEDGLFHRDIKPANIVLSSAGAKLIDFNIAAQAITVGQTFTGTQGYMLPETGIMRWSADGDLFATGIVLYELITGYHPYPERQPVTDISPTNPLNYVSDLNPNLAKIMLRAVSCDSKVRYHSARQFKQDVLEMVHHL